VSSVRASRQCGFVGGTGAVTCEMRLTRKRGKAIPCQGKGREFEPRLPLHSPLRAHFEYEWSPEGSQWVTVEPRGFSERYSRGETQRWPSDPLYGMCRKGRTGHSWIRNQKAIPLQQFIASTGEQHVNTPRSSFPYGGHYGLGEIAQLRQTN